MLKLDLQTLFHTCTSRTSIIICNLLRIQIFFFWENKKRKIADKFKVWVCDLVTHVFFIRYQWCFTVEKMMFDVGDLRTKRWQWGWDFNNAVVHKGPFCFPTWKHLSLTCYHFLKQFSSTFTCDFLPFSLPILVHSLYVQIKRNIKVKVDGAAVNSQLYSHTCMRLSTQNQ